MSGYYDPATICLNGHVISSITANATNFCDQCGSSTISHCQKCSCNIRGSYNLPDIIDFSEYYKPAYCFNCGKEFPWTEKLLNNAIELISLDEELSDNDKEIIKNAIPDLIVETPSSPVATAKYKKLIPKAAEYVQVGLRNILIDIVSETAKKSIWN